MLILKNEQKTIHASKRLQQRYGDELNNLLVNGILSQINRGKGKFIQVMPRTGNLLFRVKYRKMYEVIVDKTKTKILTFLSVNSKEARQAGMPLLYEKKGKTRMRINIKNPEKTLPKLGNVDDKNHSEDAL